MPQLSPRLVLALGALALPCGASAQTAALGGTVRGDSTSARLAGAQVELPQLGRGARTDAEGRFLLGRLPAGRHAVVVRHVGFAPVTDTVQLSEGETATRDFVLRAQVPTLDSVVVTAPERRYLSPALRAVEERRKQGHGRFITEEDLRRNDDRRLGAVVRQKIPGIRVVQRGTKSFLASTRPATLRPRDHCYVDIFVDGVLLSPEGRSDPAVDIDALHVIQFAAAEFYPGGASIPPQYNRTANGCGVFLLWSRER